VSIFWGFLLLSFKEFFKDMVKKKIPWMILFVIIAGLSIWAVVSQSSSFSFKALIESLKHAKVPWMICAGISMLGFIVFEGLALSSLIKGVYKEKKHPDGIVYAAADVYFSAITPSASGGQPASAFFMMWDGIPTAETTIVLLVNLIMYNVVLMLLGGIAFIIHGEIFYNFELPGQILIIIGVVVLVLLVVGFLMLIKKHNIMRSFFILLIMLGYKLHIIKYPHRRIRKLELTVARYSECAEAISGKVGMLLQAFIYNFLQKLSQILVTVFCYLALGGNIHNFDEVLCSQILVTVGSNSVPIPGSMGVADYLLLHALSEIKDIENPANLELLSRGISFYICIVVSIIILICGYVSRRIKGSSKNKDN
jgi:uncharacterized membrane protein YbhN (UPF0104 family)